MASPAAISKADSETPYKQLPPTVPQSVVPELRPKATADVSHTDGATGSTALPDSSHLYPLPQNIVIVHADDDVMPRIFMETVLQHSNAHPASRILGENYDELVNLPQSVSELATEHGHDRVIVVLDQRLEIPGEPPLHGTDLCRQLRAEFKFEGLVLMLSANDESEACETAKKAGADGLAAKGLHASVNKLKTVLATLYHQKFSSPHK